MKNNDDEQQLEIKKINDWMDKNHREAVELYLESVGIEDDYVLTEKFIDFLYDKLSDEIFDYLSEHQEEMR